jgi:hypothetical protein
MEQVCQARNGVAPIIQRGQLTRLPSEWFCKLHRTDNVLATNPVVFVCVGLMVRAKQFELGMI